MKFVNALITFLLAVILVAVLAGTSHAQDTCDTCHDGSNPNAPNVYAYWDGSWWDTFFACTLAADKPTCESSGGTWAGFTCALDAADAAACGILGGTWFLDASIQHGGHGDPDRKPALTCTGATGCHDLAGEATHGNGILETAGNPSANTAHLRDIFISSSSDPAYAVAEMFNTACATTCHPGNGVGIDSLGAGADSPIPYTPRYGQNLTLADADGSSGPRVVKPWVDSDLTTFALAADPDFVLCVACHDPHGTSILDQKETSGSNKMVRGGFRQAPVGEYYICFSCHGADAAPATPTGLAATDSDFDDRIALSWSDVDGETGYRIYRAASGIGPFTLVATTGPDQTAWDDPVTCGETWYYQVSAHDTGIESPPSPADIGSTCFAPTGGIEGTVTAQGSGSGVDGVLVHVYDTFPSFVTAAVTSGGGSYAISGLPPGDYKLLFLGAAAQFRSEWYDSRPGAPVADTVTVTGGAATAGIDAVLGKEGDWDGDGVPDLVWRNMSTGADFLWYMSPPVSSGSAMLPTVGTDWSIDSTDDFNGDGMPDLLWRNYVSGANFIWYMNGTAPSGSAMLPVIGTDWAIDGTGDFNGDGKTDIFWRNYSTGANYIWFMDDSTFIGGTFVSSVATQWVLGSTADFNGDGSRDLLWRNNSTGACYIWYLNGSVVTGGGNYPSAGFAWTLGGSRDFNGDGKPDLLWRNPATGDNYVWYMNDAAYLGLDIFPTAGTAWEPAE